MKLGATLDVYRRTDEGALGPLVGRALLVQADVAQALPPLDAQLASGTDDTLALAVRPRGDTRSRPVDARHHYVGRVSPAEAHRIAAKEAPTLRLVERTDVLVFLGLTEALTERGPHEASAASTLCKIVCLWYCTGC